MGRLDRFPAADVEGQATLRSIKRLLTEMLSQESDRDKQRLVGPSSLAGCPYCLGEEMLGLKEQKFGWYPRLGTAFHYWAEHHNNIPGAVTEMKVDVFEIAGYGKIRGTMDLYLPDYKTVVDYKLVGKNTREYAMVDGASTQYRGQGHCYGKGAINAGFEVEHIAIAYIPRDSASLKDMFVHQEPYNPVMVDKIQARAQKIWDTASTEGHEGLPSSEECYRCKREGRA